MIRHLAVGLLAVALCGALWACGDGTGPGGVKTCHLSIGPTNLPGGVSVTYDVTATGDGTVSSFTYELKGGEVTVPNPPLPFHADTPLQSGAQAFMTATGTIGSGSIRIELHAVSTSGEQATLQDSCTR